MKNTLYKNYIKFMKVINFFFTICNLRIFCKIFLISKSQFKKKNNKI